MIRNNRSDTTLAINTNLVGKRVKEFIDRTNDMAPIDLYTSAEAFGAQAEYIRDGLVWEEWTNNLEYAAEHGNLNGIHIMCTVNGLCLDSLDVFLNHIMYLKAKWLHKVNINFTLNILRFPSFQSPLAFPDNIRTEYKEKLETMLASFKDSQVLFQMEKNHIQRLIDYLDVVKTPHDDTFDQDKLNNDIKHFYRQYDDRRGKNFTKTFPKLADWYNKL